MKQNILRLHDLRFFLLISFLFINVLSAGLISLSRTGIIAEGFRDIYAGVAGTDSIRWPIQSLILEKYRFQNGLNIYSICLSFIPSTQLLSITETRQQQGNTGFWRCLRSWKGSRMILSWMAVSIWMKRISRRSGDRQIQRMESSCEAYPEIRLE